MLKKMPVISNFTYGHLELKSSQYEGVYYNGVNFKFDDGELVPFAPSEFVNFDIESYNATRPIDLLGNELTSADALNKVRSSNDVLVIYHGGCPDGVASASVIYSVLEDKATYLASVSFSNPELRDCLAKSLLDRCPDAPEWALTWLLEGEEYHDIRPVALIVLARWFTRQGRLESEPLRLRLLEIGFELLSVEETDRIAPLQQAALLMLKRWGRYDAEARQAILGREELTLWHSGDHPIYREFAEDLLFELNFEL